MLLGQDDFLLRLQPNAHCYTEGWLPWAVVAGTGALVYCLGTPAAIIRAARALAGGTAAQRRLVHVLTKTYRPACNVWEGVDLLRKFLLTGVIFLVQPETRVQLWFGVILNLAALMVHSRVLPFRSALCNTIQAAVHLQILFTYLTAGLFFVDDLSSLAGTNAMWEDNEWYRLLAPPAPHPPAHHWICIRPPVRRECACAHMSVAGMGRALSWPTVWRTCWFSWRGFAGLATWQWTRVRGLCGRTASRR